ncbi:MAG: RluA family pseudouridine synthase, partial [Planctomycetaceae bacterium]|nr:RluA family pseudouridine synthase [Planctomycetaceae bacterium]
VDKRYIGLVKGSLKNLEGEIVAPIARRDHAGKHSGRSKVDVGKGLKAAKPAITRYRVLSQAGNCSLVEFELITGRTHQIRAHLKHVGSALVGDDEYGDRTFNRYAKEKFGVARQFLHASQLRFKHPSTKKNIDVAAPLPEDLMCALDAAGFASDALPPALAQEFETNVRVLGSDEEE